MDVQGDYWIGIHAKKKHFLEIPAKGSFYNRVSLRIFQSFYSIGFVDNVSKEWQYEGYCIISNEGDFFEMRAGVLL